MSKAAAQGLVAAQYEYAVMLLRGFGLKEDEQKEIPLLQTAAEKGIAGAQNRLAWIHQEGVGGVPKNPAEAAKWRLIAKAGGIADDRLDLLFDALSDSEKKAAQKAAQEWRDKSFTLR
jgi:TPR repeat protein